jgi:hypothetical protein
MWLLTVLVAMMAMAVKAQLPSASAGPALWRHVSLWPLSKQCRAAPVICVRPQPELPVRVQPPPAGLRQQHTPIYKLEQRRCAAGYATERLQCPVSAIPVARSHLWQPAPCTPATCGSASAHAHPSSFGAGCGGCCGGRRHEGPAPCRRRHECCQRRRCLSCRCPRHVHWRRPLATPPLWEHLRLHHPGERTLVARQCCRRRRRRRGGSSVPAPAGWHSGPPPAGRPLLARSARCAAAASPAARVAWVPSCGQWRKDVPCTQTVGSGLPPPPPPLSGTQCCDARSARNA